MLLASRCGLLRKVLLLVVRKDFFRGESGADASPVGVIEKIEILPLVEKSDCPLFEVVFERNGEDAGIFECVRKVCQGVARSGYVAWLDEKRGIDCGAVWHQKNDEIKTL
jgi:hypothetical protein